MRIYLYTESVVIIKSSKHKDSNGTFYGDNPIRDEYKCDPPLNTSVLQFKSEKGKHITQKPTTMMEWIFKYYSKEGDTVLDPTMGSSSMGVACKSMNRYFISIEKDENI